VDADGTMGDGIHLPFNFNLIELDWNAEAVKAHVDAYEVALPSHGTPNYVLGNHDVARVASRVGVEQARVATMLLLTLRGVPTVYYGDEIGMTNVDIPQHLIQDPQGSGTNGFIRDKARTPMQWDDLPNAGFCDEDVTPWLPVSEDAGAVNVVTEQEFESSFLGVYQRLIRLRREIPALHAGQYVPLTSDEGIFLYLRTMGEEKYLIALNFTGDVRTLYLDDFDSGYILLSTIMDGYRKPDFLARLSVLDLRRHEGIIVRL